MNAFDTGARPIRILLVDRRPAVRRAIKMRLATEEDLEVVGEARDAVEANSLARALLPDVVLTDFETSGTGGAAATDRLRAAPQGAVVIFALRHGAASKEGARTAGAASSVARRRTEEILLATIRGAAGAQATRRRHDRVSAGAEE